MRLGDRALVAGLLALAGIGVEAACLVAAPDDPLASARGAALLALGSAGLFGSLALAAAALARSPARRTLGLAKSRLPWGETLLVVVGVLGVSQAVDVAIEWSGARGASVLDEVARALAGARGSALALALAGIALAPAVSEELLFRGVLQGSLLRVRALPAPVAIIVASLAFGAAHLDAVQSPATVVLGLYLGAIAWVAGSVRPAVLAHALNNAVAVLSAAFGAGLPGPPWAVAAAALAVAAPGLVVLARRRPPDGAPVRDPA